MLFVLMLSSHILFSQSDTIRKIPKFKIKQHKENIYVFLLNKF